jgi:putative ABC transport system ATP-binding protein
VEVLRTENLRKVYGEGENQVEAVKGITLSIKRGEFVAIMGPSGSGKSTLLHMMGGIEKPTEGKVFIDGTDIYKMDEEKLAIFRRRNIGIVYQFYNLISVLNVVENIALPANLDGRDLNDQRMNEMLNMLNIADRASFYPDQLSGGQQQRVSIGRALINAPAVVLADEPTGNLDSKNSQDILELFKLSNKKYKQTLIIITHDEEIALQADRIITIDDGVVVRDEETR